VLPADADDGHRALGKTPAGKERDRADKVLNDPEVLKHLEVPEHLYHITDRSNLAAIQKDGLKFGGPRATKDGEIRGVYLTDTTDAHDLGKQGGDFAIKDPVTVRVKTAGLKLRLDPEYFYYDDKTAKGAKAYVDSVNAGEDLFALYSPKNVPASHVEVMTANAEPTCLFCGGLTANEGGGSFFGHCKRDAKGHCTKGGGGGGGKAQDGGNGDGDAVTPTVKADPAALRRRPGTKGTTHEGVDADRAGKLTRDEAKEVLRYNDDLGFMVNGQGKNRGLPAETRPKGLSDTERGALQKYSFKNDLPLNQALRRGDLDKMAADQPVGYRNMAGQDAKTPYPPAFFQEMHAQMQGAFAKAPVLSSPVKVVRGMKLSPDNQKAFASKMEAAMTSGGAVSFDGYTSTARPAGVLAKMGLGSGIPGPFRGNVSVSINAVHGLDMSPHSQLPGEGEFLINHGAKFKVKKVTMKKDGLHVELDQLPPDAAPTGNVYTVNAPADDPADEVEDDADDAGGETGDDLDAELTLEDLYEDDPDALAKWLDTDFDFMKFLDETADAEATADDADTAEGGDADEGA
jgi:hypothetical protein